MFGFLPGITTPGGATHQAVEDVALMRSLPNMTVLETGDATEVESVLDVMAAVEARCTSACSAARYPDCSLRPSP